MQGFDAAWENEIYSQGRMVNRYPFGELVSYVMGLYASKLRQGEKLKVLELGSGAGNNLAFFAREGFETHGIDGSESACRIAADFLGPQGLRAEIKCGDFARLPYPDSFFDLIVDREAVYANRKQVIVQVAAEVRRCLRPGGRFLSFAYSTDHGALGRGDGEKIESNTYTGFKSGSFKDAGVTHFFTRDEIVHEYFEGFEVEFLHHHKSDSLLPEKSNLYSEYIICGRKR